MTFDSGVPNDALDSGCTINDLILDDDPWDNHGRFVSHVSAVTDELMSDDVFVGRERGAIISAAARSDVGEPGRAAVITPI